MSSALQTITVTRESDAFELLKDALSNQFSEQNIRLEFVGWPIITLRLVGEGYDSTVTSSMATALVDLQHAMNRTYARMVHGTNNPNVLTHQQRQALAFKAKVEKGSSLINVDLGAYASELTTGLIGKMDGPQVIALVLGTAVTAGSVIAYKAYLKHKSEDKKAELETQEKVKLAQEDTKKFEIMQQAFSKHPQLVYVRQDFDDARHSFLKSVGDADSIEHQGVELSRESARKIISTSRTISEEAQLNGYYLIEKLDWTKEGEVRISVSSTERHLEFIARLKTTALTVAQKETLKSAEWTRTKLHLQINATVLRGEVTSAVIVGVEWEKPGNGSSVKT